MSQAPNQNSEKRHVPEGWIEHFDSQRGLWYYVDLNSDPPRVSLVHPLDIGNEKSPISAASKVLKDHLRLSPTQRPVGPRDSTSSPSNGSSHSSQRPRRATVAQQLYSSSLSVGPKDTLHGTTVLENGSKTASRFASASSTPVSEGIVLNSSSSAGTSPSSSASSTSSSSYVSPTSPITPSPSMDIHNPRNFLDCTRLVGTRRGTYSGPQPSLGPKNAGKIKFSPIPASNREQEFFGPNAFYPASVKPTPSPKPSRSISLEHQNNHQHLATALSAPNSYHIKPAMKSVTLPSFTGSSTGSPKSLITGKTITPLLSIPRQPDVVTNETNLTSNHKANNSSTSRSLSLPLKLPKQESTSANVRPLPPTTKQIDVIVSSPPQIILQPKPMRPLAGVSLDLQVQVAGVESEPSPDQLTDLPNLNSKKKKNPLLKSLNIGLSKNVKGKTPIRTIYDRQMLSSSPIIDELPPGAIL